MVENKSDVELVRLMRGGRQDAFQEMIDRYSGKVFSLASRLTRNPQDAEEVLQDVFVTVHRKIRGFEGKSSFSSWLYRVTVNAALMKLRKNRQEQSLSVEDVLPQFQNSLLLTSNPRNEGEYAALRAQLVAALESAIRRLPPDYRGVFVLRDIDGLTSREVSKIMDLSIPAVKSRLHRSRLILRRRLLPLYREYVGGNVRERAANE